MPQIVQYLTRDICIMKRTTNDRNPSKFNTLGPAKTLLISCISQKELCSQSCNWEFRKFTKWRISAHEGSGIPQLLCEQKGVAQLLQLYIRHNEEKTNTQTNKQTEKGMNPCHYNTGL